MKKRNHHVEEFDITNYIGKAALEANDVVLVLELVDLSEENRMEDAFERVSCLGVFVKDALGGLQIALKELSYRGNGVVINIFVNLQKRMLCILDTFFDEAISNTVFLIDNIRVDFLALLFKLDHTPLFKLKNIAFFSKLLNTAPFTFNLAKYCSALSTVTISTTCFSTSFIFCKKCCFFSA